MTFPAEELTADIARLTGAVEALTGDGETLTGDGGGLMANVGTLTGHVEALTFDVEGLTFDVGALTFDVFGLKNETNWLIYRHLQQNLESMIKKRQFRSLQTCNGAEYCLRDVRATVELYKIWKERLAGIK